MDERTCNILMILLAANDYMTFSEIEEELENTYHIACNVKTIKSAINNINHFFEVFFGIHEAIICIKKKGTLFDRTILDKGEIKFLYDSLVNSSSFNGQSIFNKLTALIPNEYMNNQKQIDQNLIYLNTIMNAIEHKVNIRFKYVNFTYNEEGQLIEYYQNHGSEGENKELYIVSPYRVVMRGGKYYLFGCTKKHSDRLITFRIDRMREVVSLKKTGFIDKYDEWDIDNQIERSVNMFSSNKEITLELQCKNKALRPIVDQFGEDIFITPGYGELLNIKIENVYESDGLIGWIMMMSPDIKVISPSSLVEELKQKLQKSSDLYKEKD